MRHANLWLLLFCGLTALLWAMLMPLWQFPDEINHFAAIQNYAENRSNPVAENISFEAAETHRLTGAGLPLSLTRFGFNEQYLRSLSAGTRTRYVESGATENSAIANIFGAFAYEQILYGSIFARVFAIRLVSVLPVLGIVLAAYYITREFFPDLRSLQLAAAVSVGLSPLLLYQVGGANSRGLVILVFSLLLLKGVTVLFRPVEIRDLWQIAVTAIFGALVSPLVFFTVIPVVVAVMASTIALRPAKNVTIASIAFIILTIALYVAVKRLIPGFELVSSSAVLGFLTNFSAAVPTTPVISTTLLSLAALSLVGWGVYFYYERQKLSPIALLPGLWLITAILIFIISMIGKTGLLAVWQAGTFNLNFLYPFVIPVTIGLFSGWWHLAKRWVNEKAFSLVVLIVAVALNVACLYHLLDTYYDLVPVSTFLNQVSQYKPLFAKWPNLIIPVVVGVVSLITLIASNLKTNENENR